MGLVDMGLVDQGLVNMGLVNNDRSSNALRMPSSMDPVAAPASLAELGRLMTGDLHNGDAMRRIYATDASAYQELPQAVAIPRTTADLKALILFADRTGASLIPRAAGTSLAGQVVGAGIVADISRHFTSVLEINRAEQWVRVQPGVIRNELNQALAPHGMLFGPETSTQNRAMLGGMLGNNSCGSNSVKYGSVRDHLLEATALLSDGSEVVFRPLSVEEFLGKCGGPPTLETRIYQDIRDMLSGAETRAEIAREYPKPSIPRRNTGYALDLLMDSAAFGKESDKPFHFGKLIAGSEGTLCLVTEMKLHCDLLPPPVSGLQCAHFATVDEALRATQLIVRHDCYACELMDNFILDCTRRSPEHRHNRFFIEGDPGAILVTDIRGQTRDDVLRATSLIEREIRDAGLGYAFPVLFGPDTVRIWDLRKAGLGLMNNVPGDEKPASVVEDTAVDVADLSAYIAEFDQQLQERFGLQCVRYAHAGSGEIHLRPILNLKTEEGVRLFREVAQAVADLVKKYRGSLSGEHGDGRLRGEFLRQMIGPQNYALVERVKRVWDPRNIFNPGKIVGTPPMNTQLRHPPGRPTPDIKTAFDWTREQGVVRAAEMCTGSGDCRKTQLTGGVMCPSYMATRNEQDTTRARANLLRQILTESESENPFDDARLKDVLDLCLSCKGCKQECPSSVDMAKLKAEFQQNYYDANGSPWRSKLIARFAATQSIAARAPWLWNLAFGAAPVRRLLNRLVGFHPERTIPRVSSPTWRRWMRKRGPQPGGGEAGEALLLCDEFTNYSDAPIGIKTVELLERLGYRVQMTGLLESGRTWLSKGFVRRARRILNKSLASLEGLVDERRPLIGVEPSALLTFRDELLDLADPPQKAVAERIAPHCLTLEEFLAREAAAGRVSHEAFSDESRTVHLHGHCFQKALTGLGASIAALSLPKNYSVKTIPSGCCGMAGAFGYEAEHYALSMQIGELVLFPAIRQLDGDCLIAAAGTSCRHQIHDGTGRRAMHPAEILHAALRSQTKQLAQLHIRPRTQ